MEKGQGKTVQNWIKINAFCCYFFTGIMRKVFKEYQLIKDILEWLKVS